MIIEEILELAVSKKASDIHISANLPPVLRIDGKLFRTNLPVLSPDDVETPPSYRRSPAFHSRSETVSGHPAPSLCSAPPP